ncbi:DUF6624 domain-containing protein [Chryseobacterium indoltheticum]|uniref:Uncharacterized protein n=1 Tax=Chryseobacterium indoltheticum TaxID=254 RepID=A0A381JSP5_9FLAO|nr:DUF6624 domain-containing protein [Chryseobacterium indoltheticum]AZA75600.1 hypothetical protein EG358_18440 [Chryseobacterium indoltheticum]SIQ44328.1 hypothetical protein SAMN05421682_10547 [Chryseobacterium indoltheticum]SUY53728.1 Uncharacterised protein [Chryseobacterium indoltheticum]
MKKKGFLFLLIFGFSNAFSQAKNEELKKELDEILRLDQTYRKLFDNGITSAKKSEILKSLNIDEEDFKSEDWQLVATQDSINIRKIDKIISEYGYPGKTLVGEPTNTAAWYIIQHSDKIEKYLPIIKEAEKKGELPFSLVAMMEDRYLMENGKEQIYGTQGHSTYYEKNGKGYQTEDIIWPIKNPKKINEIRKKAGFRQTIEEYAKDLYGKDFVYNSYTLDDIENNRIDAKEVTR